ncbi:MAG: hypothetical protein ACKVY0_02550 [Prosthecobacter sp.]|uniref:hypothetical protein n=1 Tax=Prosthecobacter sp. TaxID=1965333 RepID=UPI0038FFC636
MSVPRKPKTSMPRVTPAFPITFAVFHDDEPADATLDFADNADVISTTRWRVPTLDDETLQTRAADSREFALLAAKRWRHYRDTDSAAHSLADLRRLIAADPQGEFCFHLKITADWFPASLGGAMLRRTWHHHLALDFLFVHPRIASRLVNVKSVGVAVAPGHLHDRANHGMPASLGRDDSRLGTFLPALSQAACGRSVCHYSGRDHHVQREV